jgi:hypothetical protein
MAALMLYSARGDVIDMSQILPTFAMPRLKTVLDHLRDVRG